MAAIEAILPKLSDGARTVDKQNISGLHWAAINNRLLVCKALLDAGADPNLKGGDLVATPMHWAAK